MLEQVTRWAAAASAAGLNVEVLFATDGPETEAAVREFAARERDVRVVGGDGLPGGALLHAFRQSRGGCGYLGRDRVQFMLSRHRVFRRKSHVPGNEPSIRRG